MSFFPRTILLATDGSDEADLATQAAAELSKATASEVRHLCAADRSGVDRSPCLHERNQESLLEQAERDSRSVLEERAERVRSEGGKVAETPQGGATGQGDRQTCPGAGGGDDHVGQPGTRRAR